MSDVLYCVNCTVEPQARQNICETCYKYLRKTGKPRPKEVIARTWQRKVFAGR